MWGFFILLAILMALTGQGSLLWSVIVWGFWIVVLLAVLVLVFRALDGLGYFS